LPPRAARRRSVQAGRMSALSRRLGRNSLWDLAHNKVLVTSRSRRDSKLRVYALLRLNGYPRTRLSGRASVCAIASLGARTVHLLSLANRHQLSVEFSCLIVIGDLQTEAGYPPPHEEPMNGLTRNRHERLEDHLDGSISRDISDRRAPRQRRRSLG
jgi:hypothetical protein